MNLRNWHRGAGWLLMGVLTLAANHQLKQPLWAEPEIALEIGGTYEEMRNRSSASFSPLLPGNLWLGIPAVDARLRLIDPQYGFITPLARFFTVGFDDNVIEDIRMSPQIEPLLLDDALKVVLDLQDQWRKKGWVAMGLRNNPTIADTPEWRAWLGDSERSGRSFWQAGDKYQVMLVLGQFTDYRNPTEERYLITLSIARPWVPFDEIEEGWEQENPLHPGSPKQSLIPESTAGSGEP
ncbi:hypothetical protein PS662_05291 [Pseudomonas fluorescens]|uniref:Uncharacterized protein n=1 Tax=Pseudomonas fluorescens TaxID=294 RepID=A0A5E6X9V0_PSEFL|nr:hypothetical protein [Pseudomonas fluorescens]VVN38128.1 hypothetical protein PS662_05291 [Pseudomonas fluorescens]